MQSRYNPDTKHTIPGYKRPQNYSRKKMARLSGSMSEVYAMAEFIAGE